MKLETFPWLKPIVEKLAVQLDNGNLPHALLISGPASIGKTLLTKYLSSRLLCTAKRQACGACHQCKLLKAGTHPDYLHITPGDSKQIVIAQIRSMSEWIGQTSQQGGQKVCVIRPAHCMNMQAANSLLKSLEEPPEATKIILISDAPNRLLPTIRSRCQHLVCRMPERTQAIEWLRQYHLSAKSPELVLDIAGGVPARAMEIIDEDYLSLRASIAETLPLLMCNRVSPVQVAGNFAEDDPAMVLDIMYHLIADSLCCSLSGNSFRNHDLGNQLENLVLKVDVDLRFDFLNRLCRAREILSGQSNANIQMLFEWLLLT